jgi:preprotein translocase subunit SecY
MAQTSHLPLKLNMTGVMPTIFASTVLGIPVTAASFLGSHSVLVGEFLQGRWLYNIFFVCLIFGFCYLYASIIFKPEDIAENLKKQHAYIPGIRPGGETTEGLTYVVSRLIFVGGFFMNVVVLVPLLTGSRYLPGGTSLLIVVSVALDAYRKVMTYRATQRYDSFLQVEEDEDEFDLSVQSQKIKFVSN